MSSNEVIDVILGKAIYLAGDNIDTDRIFPARFMTCITYTGVEQHVFEDDRKAAKANGLVHPFDRAAGAKFLIVGRNFGCGSSREHAPQALYRFGIRCIIGESFSDIFFYNCASIGMVCVTTSMDNLRALAELLNPSDGVHEEKNCDFVLDLANLNLSGGGLHLRVTIQDNLRKNFLEGSWNSMTRLLNNTPLVLQKSKELIYFS